VRFAYVHLRWSEGYGIRTASHRSCAAASLFPQGEAAERLLCKAVIKQELRQRLDGLADRMPLQRRLKAQSAALAQSTQDLCEQFRTDLRDWVGTPTDDTDDTDPLTATLQFNVAFAVVSTAYQTWQANTCTGYGAVSIKPAPAPAAKPPAPMRSDHRR
jgi:hypothetical protein